MEVVFTSSTLIMSTPVHLALISWSPKLFVHRVLAQCTRKREKGPFPSALFILLESFSLNFSGFHGNSSILSVKIFRVRGRALKITRQMLQCWGRQSSVRKHCSYAQHNQTGSAPRTRTSTHPPTCTQMSPTCTSCMRIYTMTLCIHAPWNLIWTFKYYVKTLTANVQCDFPWLKITDTYTQKVRL